MKSCNKAFYEKDSWLKPYQEIIIRRSNNIKWRKDALAGRGGRLYDSINNHLYYMLHNDGKDWLFRDNRCAQVTSEKACDIIEILDEHGAVHAQLRANHSVALW